MVRYLITVESNFSSKKMATTNHSTSPTTNHSTNNFEAGNLKTIQGQPTQLDIDVKCNKLSEILNDYKTVLTEDKLKDDKGRPVEPDVLKKLLDTKEQNIGPTYLKTIRKDLRTIMAWVYHTHTLIDIHTYTHTHTHIHIDIQTHACIFVEYDELYDSRQSDWETKRSVGMRNCLCNCEIQIPFGRRLLVDDIVLTHIKILTYYLHANIHNIYYYITTTFANEFKRG